jgi:hypothetical protein
MCVDDRAFNGLRARVPSHMDRPKAYPPGSSRGSSHERGDFKASSFKMRSGDVSYGGGDFARQNTARRFRATAEKGRVRGTKGGMLLAPFTK